jgi:hypothetical protein
MGFIKDVKATTMGKDAAKAWDAGNAYFTPLLNMPATRPGLSGAVEDWPLMLDAITEVGWKMHTWFVGSDEKGRPQAMPLFTR